MSQGPPLSNHYDWIGVVYFLSGVFMEEMEKLMEMIEVLEIDLDTKSELMIQLGKADAEARRWNDGRN